MNGLDKIIETILADAASQKEQILAQAHQEAEEIAARYVDTVNQRNAQLKAAAEEKASQAKERLLANAELEARKSLLQAKQDLINQAFEQALAQIAAYPEAQLVELLANLAVQATVSGQEQLLFNPEARQAYGEQVVKAANQALKQAGKNANLSLAGTTRPIGLGLVLLDGPIEINCVLDNLIWDRRDALAQELAELLFAS